MTVSEFLLLIAFIAICITPIIIFKLIYNYITDKREAKRKKELEDFQKKEQEIAIRRHKDMQEKSRRIMVQESAQPSNDTTKPSYISSTCPMTFSSCISWHTCLSGGMNKRERIIMLGNNYYEV